MMISHSAHRSSQTIVIWTVIVLSVAPSFSTAFQIYLKRDIHSLSHDLSSLRANRHISYSSLTSPSSLSSPSSLMMTLNFKSNEGDEFEDGNNAAIYHSNSSSTQQFFASITSDKNHLKHKHNNVNMTNNDNNTLSPNENYSKKSLSSLSNHIYNIHPKLQTSVKILKYIANTSKETFTDFFFHTQFGKRGEGFILFEMFLLNSMFIGKIPLVNDLIRFLFGPMFLVCGMLLIGLSMREFNSVDTLLEDTKTNQRSISSDNLNENSLLTKKKIMTAYTNPIITTNTSTNIRPLITTGIYSYIRHPFYTGILCSFIGTSILTKSIVRMIISTFYYMLMNQKCQKEEHELLKVYKNTYMSYEHRVRGRFLPSRERIRYFLDFVTNNMGGEGKKTTNDKKIEVGEKVEKMSSDVIVNEKTNKVATKNDGLIATTKDDLNGGTKSGTTNEIESPKTSSSTSNIGDKKKQRKRGRLFP